MRIKVSNTQTEWSAIFWKAPHGWTRTTWRDIDGFIVKETK